MRRSSNTRKGIIATAEVAVPARLQYLPISVFSIVLGLCGYVMATQKVGALHGFSPQAGQILLAVTTAIYGLLVALYVAKAVRWWPEVAAELKHPTKLSFFPAISISLLLLSAAFLDVDRQVSAVLWYVGVGLQLIVSLGVLSAWIRHTHFQIQHFSPAWFIPVVGNLIVPVAGVEHGPADVSWLFFAAGLVFGIVLFAILMYRMLFHQPLNDRLLPTLFIVVAPPAVGAISYYKLTGAFDAFFRVLYFLAAFLLLLLIVHASGFVRVKFSLSWWAYLFPIAAFTIVTTVVSRVQSSSFYSTIATGLWVALTALVIVVAARTLVAIARHEICVPE